MMSLFLKVPLICDFLIYLRLEKVFRKFINSSFFFFSSLFLLQRILPFQYGKTYTKGKSYLRLEVRDRVSFLLVHSSGPIIFVYSYFFFYAYSYSAQFNYNQKSDVNEIYQFAKQNIINDVNNSQNKELFDNNNDVKKFTKDQNNENSKQNTNENDNNSDQNQRKSFTQVITFKSFMKNFISMPSILYLIHYSHRLLVYPWFRSRNSKPWPLESVIFFSFNNIISGVVLSWTLFFKYRRLPIIVQVILSILFLALIFLSSFHDYYLCSLRQPGESGYRIPKGVCFNWVSCPHYTFELAAWFVFGFFIRGKFGEKYLFWLIEFVNLSIRATSSTIAYRKMFNLKYPVRRNPILPIFYSPV